MPRFIAGTLLLAAFGLMTADAGAQRGRRGGFGGVLTREIPKGSYDGSFRFCRISFRNSPQGDGDGWYVDWPRADENLATRLGELTKAPVTRDAEGNPLHAVFPLTDPELFNCGFVMMTEPGGSYFDDAEAAQLRLYLLKGGFLWADDFWGSYAWNWWAGQIGKALPPGQYPIFDVPLSDPMFHMLFDIKEIPQIPNIGLWIRAQVTSERGADSAVPELKGIRDDHGRIIAVFTHNTDFGDGYEREAESPSYFVRFSVPAYAIGADVILYAMTH
jgi:hypothetical protein